MPEDRLVIFADPSIAFSRVLFAAFLDELKSREDIQAVAVCDTSRKQARPLIDWLRHTVQLVFNPSMRGDSTPPFDRTLCRVIAPPKHNVNHPGVMALLRDDLRPTLALCVGCVQIWKPPLLGAFEMAVNYHDGDLPFYKGLGATAWSLYHREAHSGYTYHVMENGIDSGPLLLQYRVPIGPATTLRQLRAEKTKLAAADAKRVLDSMAARAAGTAQAGAGSYFSSTDRLRICTIANPVELTAEEIQHRLYCFQSLYLPIGGRMREVTELIEATSRDAITTKDGVKLTARRLRWMPPWLYRVTELIAAESQ